MRSRTNDPRVQVLAHEQNPGHIRTYNDGLARARGDYVVLLSADDLLAARLPVTCRGTDGAPPPGRASSTVTRTVPSEPARRGSMPGAGRCGPATRGCAASPAPADVIMSPEAVVRRTAWARTERLRHAPSALRRPGRLAATGCRLGRRPGQRQRPGALPGARRQHAPHDVAGRLTDLRERRLAFDMLFDEEPGLPTDAAVLHDRNRRALARTARRMSGSPAISAGERGEMLAFAAETWPQGSTRPSIGTRLPLRRARTRVRETARYHRWRAVGW